MATDLAVLGQELKKTAGQYVERPDADDPFKDLPPQGRVLAITLMALIKALQANVLSGDVWWLSIAAAEKEAAMMGVTKEAFEDIITRLEKFRERQRARNPMSSMF